MSKSSILSVLALLTLSTLGAAGCSNEVGSDESGDGSEADLRARSSCSAASYNAALVHYKAAVAAAKLRRSDQACDSETIDATQHGITEKVAAAVGTCGAFKDVVATSPWAAPIRETLQDNLAYYTLTGKVGEQWEGLEAALASGVKLHGPAPGAHGNMSTLTFGGEGKAVMTRLVWDNELGYPTGVDAPVTYRVSRVLSADAVELEITTNGKPVKVQLQRFVTDSSPTQSFRLILEGEEFLSFPSECDA